MDIAVIGLGQSGILFAHSLLEKGVSLTLIDSGGLESESPMMTKSDYIFETPSKMPEDVHRVGGGANHWYGRVSQFPDYVFDNSSNGWPVGSETMAPYYKKVYEMLSLGSLLDNDFSDLHLANIQQLVLPQLDVSPYYHCNPRYFSKLLADLQKSPNVSFLLNSPVLRLQETSANGTEIVFADGRILSASKVVISAGTIQSAALLLRSKIFLPRLKNANLIGRNLMEHFDGYVGTLKIKSAFLNRYSDLLDGSISKSHQVGEMSRSFGFGIKLPQDLFNDSESAYLDFHLHVEPFQEIYTFGDMYFMLPRKSKIKSLLFWSELLIRKMVVRPIRKLGDRIFQISRFSLYIKGEERPFVDSRIELLETPGNNLGKVVYHHRISKDTSNRIRSSLKEFRVRFQRLGIGRIIFFKWFMHAPAIAYTGPNWHPMGTTPLNVDKSKRITESDLSLSGYPHIFLLNAGIFPSGSYQNPSTTTLAFALRLADVIA